MSDTLFSQSYLESGLPETDEYQQIGRSRLAHFRQDLARPYRSFVASYGGSNEAQIEDALIRPCAECSRLELSAPAADSGERSDARLYAVR